MSGSRERYILVSGRETLMNGLEGGLANGRWRGAVIQISGGHGERGWTVPGVDVKLVDDMVPKYKLDATKAVLADRERELLELKGLCLTANCPLHRAHSGPCNPQQ